MYVAFFFGAKLTVLGATNGVARVKIVSLSKDVFKQCTSTGSEVFLILKYLDATKFVLLSFFTVMETTCWKIWAKPQPMNGKSLLPVDVRRSNPFCLSSLKHLR